MLFKAYSRLVAKTFRIRLHGEQEKLRVDLGFGCRFSVLRNPEIVLH